MKTEFTVSAELKALWTVELSLLEKLKEICAKWNLTYYASDGTLLGAIRHKGFIPWDDDMDFYLPWPDYRKLMEVAPRECQYPYCFQGIYSEPNAMAVSSRLRRSDTTGFTRWERENAGPGYDLGIFIDVFPLFFLPETAEERTDQKQKVMHLWRCIHGHDALLRLRRGENVSEQYESFIPEYLKLCSARNLTRVDDPDIVWLKEEYLEACAWGLDHAREVGTTSYRCHLSSMIWDAAWFARSIELPFENTTISCPAGYEKILEREYGDWRTPVRTGADHEMFVADTKTPWKQFLESAEAKRACRTETSE